MFSTRDGRAPATDSSAGGEPRSPCTHRRRREPQAIAVGAWRRSSRRPVPLSCATSRGEVVAPRRVARRTSRTTRTPATAARRRPARRAGRRRRRPLVHRFRAFATGTASANARSHLGRGLAERDDRRAARSRAAQHRRDRDPCCGRPRAARRRAVERGDSRACRVRVRRLRVVVPPHPTASPTSATRWGSVGYSRERGTRRRSRVAPTANAAAAAASALVRSWASARAHVGDVANELAAASRRTSRLRSRNMPAALRSRERDASRRRGRRPIARPLRRRRRTRAGRRSRWFANTRALAADVLLERAVPVEWSRRDREQHGDPRPERLGRHASWNDDTSATSTSTSSSTASRSGRADVAGGDDAAPDCVEHRAGSASSPSSCRSCRSPPRSAAQRPARPRGRSRCGRRHRPRRAATSAGWPRRHQRARHDEVRVAARASGDAGRGGRLDAGRTPAADARSRHVRGTRRSPVGPSSTTVDVAPRRERDAHDGVARLRQTDHERRALTRSLRGCGGSRRRRCRSRARRRCPANSQNRTITVNSDQPPTSKWWWIGAMRSTRRRKPRNETTCAITLSVSTHGQPAEDRQQQVGVGQQRQARHRAADGERAGVAHEDARRRRVPPQETRRMRRTSPRPRSPGRAPGRDPAGTVVIPNVRTRSGAGTARTR